MSQNGQDGVQLPAPRLTKILNDPIHGHIELNADLFKIIDSPEFQRLRDLKQLGGMYYVFPGATHNRFEHCIGTCYLAGKWIRHFQWIMGSAIVSDRDVFLVELAGLCHDLGHGPFSHMFETVVANGLGVYWDHEEASCLLLEKINDRIGLLTPAELQRVQDMIIGKIPEGDKKRTFMYQIVHNNINSVDVDKFDYLNRDSRCAKLPLSFDFKRLMRFSCVDYWGSSPSYEICFNSKEGMNLFNLFHSRYCLHKQVYTHLVVKSIELMIGDILIAASEEFQIADTLRTKDMARYMLFNDSILYDIPRRVTFSKTPPSEDLKKANDLLWGLNNRNLYKFVAETSIASNHIKDSKRLVKSAQDYLEKVTGRTDFSVIRVIVNFAMEGRNPLAHVRLYTAMGTGPVWNPTMEEISPVHKDMKFEEAVIRVFSKDRDMEFRKTLSEAFRSWVEKEPHGQLGTPSSSAKHLIEGISSSGKKHTTDMDRDMTSPKKLRFEGDEDEEEGYTEQAWS